MHELYSQHSTNVMVLSFPDLPYLPWTSKKNPRSQYPTDAIEPYCFSHWPGANCFITHFCASRKQKEKMRQTYSVLLSQESVDKKVSLVTLAMMEEEARSRQIMPLCHSN